ncbi:MAG TPA: BON domain-containing protein [Kofleriaceae bacterium]|nr:BON domain-containing protein [Kofleriaceae bacterium]
MPNQNHGNGRNVALPDENRPTWRPQDEHRRRAASEEDDRFDDDRRRYWEDRRDWRDDYRTGYPGGRRDSYSYEDRYRGSSGYGFDEDRPGYGVPAFGHRGKGPQSYTRSDERVRELVCEALTDDDRIDATHVDVAVKAGEVTLSGSVDERFMKRLAEDCALSVPGVHDVQNQIRIGHHEGAMPDKKHRA